jgi:hypothetical protein
MTRYTTTITVSAWPYNGGGTAKLPGAAMDAFDAQNIEPRHVTEGYHMHQVIRDIVAETADWTPPEEGSPQDNLYWHTFDPWNEHTAMPGDWIIQHEDGRLEAVDGATFDQEYTATIDNGITKPHNG